MEKADKNTASFNEEIVEVLVALSIIAKRLAVKINENMCQTEDNENE